MRKRLYLRRLLRLVPSSDFLSEFRGPDFRCLQDPADVFNFVQDPDAWWREMEFEGRQQHHVHGSWLARCHCPEMFVLPGSEMNDIYNPKPHD